MKQQKMRLNMKKDKNNKKVIYCKKYNKKISKKRKG